MDNTRTRGILRDTLAFGGLGLVGYGVYAIYPPAAFIVIGAVLFVLGVRR